MSVRFFVIGMMDTVTLTSSFATSGRNTHAADLIARALSTVFCRIFQVMVVSTPAIQVLIVLLIFYLFPMARKKNQNNTNSAYFGGRQKKTCYWGASIN